MKWFKFPETGRPWIMIAVAITLGLAILILAMVPKSRNEMIGQVRTRFLELESGNLISLGDAPVDGLECLGSMAVESDPPFLPLHRINDVLTVRALKAGTQSISLRDYRSDAPTATLKFGFESPRRMSIHPGNVRYSFTLGLQGRYIVGLDGKDTVVDFRKPTILVIRGEGESSPLYLEVRDSGTLVEEPVPVSRLRFLKEDDCSSTPLSRSGILGGEIRLESYEGKAVALRKNDMLRFQVFTGEISSLGFSGGAYSLELYGKADYPQIGSEAQPKDLTPTLLQAILAEKNWMIAGSCVVYVIGLFWSLAKAVNPSKKESGG